MPYISNKLTEKVKSSGCAAKFSPTLLSEVLSSITPYKNEKIVQGFDNSEDCAVIDIGGGMYAVQTVDFFPPMTDNPYVFGQIAATNALSDIYAMGATPCVALSIVCFPSCLDINMLKDILKGASEKCKEAGVSISGGHTIADDVPKFGLCVTGFVQKDKILFNNTVKKDDILVLTKKLGAGIINTAIKAGVASKEAEDEVVKSMTTLNKEAVENIKDLRVSALTDVTGFSLLGHLKEMMSSNNYTAEIFTNKIKYFTNTLNYARDGLIPEGMYNNISYVNNCVKFVDDIPQEMKDLLFDPQTSGGLLLSIHKDDVDEYLSRSPFAYVIGNIKDKSDTLIEVYR